MIYEQLMFKEIFNWRESYIAWKQKMNLRNLLILFDIQRNSKPKYLIRTLKATMLITLAQQAIEYQVTF